jgi:eukaryotic-like serine/threonine-protein kinase
MASIERDPVEQLAEQWRERWRRGEQFDADEYVARYPALADDIRELFDAIALMEQLKPAARDLTGALTLAPSSGLLPAHGERLERLGDFRILREIGRGGMGVVYEAEQESLGRRVALKVLPAGVAQRSSFLERFRREARAVARLHHTNIVPVHGVGEENGTCYYAMQFIQGQALDVVLDEIKRLRGAGGNAASGNVARGNAECTVAQSVAHSLLMDRFRVGELTAASGNEPALPRAATPPSTTRTELSDQAGAGYYRRIALLGAQAAEGLAHAHSQGVLHRDIKPSNLLLDTHGTLWITDFGLAKADDSADLTEAGDIVGTIRYMAPERFQGKSDARSDVYAVGLTLYEMLALRPPFDRTDRASLIGQITSDTPPPLHSLAPNLPRDLETIVHKAMARDPAARYGSAADLAEDLHRFLENRPIKARRISVAERFRRWCRRNPVVAGLTLMVFVLLACFAVGSTVAAFWLQAERDTARSAEERARIGEERARAEEEAKTEKLYASYVDQAKASRFSRQPGQRFASLDAIRKAVQIARDRTMPPARFDELRNLAIACLALPDWRVLREWEAFPEGTFEWAWDEEHGQYARGNVQGRISLRNLQDDAEIARLTFFPGESGLAFSPGGRFLLAANGRVLRGWDLSSPDRRIVLDIAGGASAFHPNGRDLVFFRPDGALLQVDLTAPQKSQRLVANLGNAPPVHMVAFNPAGNRLAVIQAGAVGILDAKTGKIVDHIAEIGSYGQPAPVDFLAWHPQGDIVALVLVPNKIHVWDLVRKQRVSVLEGCRNAGLQVAFTPDGELLASNGWEGKLRIWNWRTGQQVLRSPAGLYPRFSPQGHLLIGDGHRGKVIELATGREYRTLVRQSNTAMDLVYWGGAIHPEGRLLAVAMNDGVRMWDLETGSETGLVRLGFPAHIAFEPAGDLLTHGDGGLLSWPVRTIEAIGAAGAELRFGPPRYRGPGAWYGIGFSRDGKVLGQAARTHAVVLHGNYMERRTVLQPQHDVRGISITPDGQYAATFSHGGGAKLWQVRDGQFIKELPVGTLTGGIFSPDGQWLAVSGGSGGRILRVGTWAERHIIRWNGGATFSPDSRFLAVETGQGVIRLIDPSTGREKARLEAPIQEMAGWLGFTPDSTRLVASSDDGKAIHVWDLRLIRQQLVELDLDWEEPPYPPAPPPQKLAPLRVTVVGAEMASNRFAMLNWELQTDSLRLLGNPFDGDAYFQRGRVYLQTGNAFKALPELNRALAFQPDHVGARFLRGKLHQQQGRWQAASEDFTRLLQRQPDDPEVHRRRGACRDALGDYAAAAADYREWLKHGDENAIVLNNLAWRVVARSKQRTDAELVLPLIEKAAAQAPGYWVVMHTLGVTYYRLDRFKEAAATLERTVKLHGQATANELYFLAMCRHRLGDKAAAKRDFDQAVRWQAQAKLSAARIEELQAFRTEAETILKGPAK